LRKDAARGQTLFWQPISGLTHADQLGEFAFDPAQRFRISVFEVAEGLPESKCARGAEWAEYHGKRIELTWASEVSEGQGREGGPPLLAL
jgi:hypothetical protein